MPGKQSRKPKRNCNNRRRQEKQKRRFYNVLNREKNKETSFMLARLNLIWKRPIRRSKNWRSEFELKRKLSPRQKP